MSGWRLRPLDVALFKDGRPFSPGEGTRATCVMDCPPPETLYGALRNVILATHSVPLGAYLDGRLDGPEAEILGRPRAGQVGTLSIRGPFWEEESDGRHQLLLSWPADLLSVRIGSQTELGYLVPRSERQDQARERANWPVPWLHGLIARIRLAAGGLGWPDDAAIEEVAARFLPADIPRVPGRNLIRYLTHTSGVQSRDAELVVDVEPQSGINKENGTGRVVDGALYTASFLRPRNGEQGRVGAFRFEVGTGAALLPDSFVVGVGGERRPFSATSVAEPLVDPAVEAAVLAHLRAREHDGRLSFRLLTLTPSLFVRNGWFPDGIDPETGTCRHNGITYTLLAAAVTSPLWLSGWDLLKRAPKPSRPHVAAGAVYFLEAAGADQLAERVMDGFWMKSLQEGPLGLSGGNGRSAARMGMGIVMVGGLEI